MKCVRWVCIAKWTGIPWICLDHPDGSETLQLIYLWGPFWVLCLNMTSSIIMGIAEISKFVGRNLPSSLLSDLGLPNIFPFNLVLPCHSLTPPRKLSLTYPCLSIGDGWRTGVHGSHVMAEWWHLGACYHEFFLFFLCSLLQGKDIEDKRTNFFLIFFHNFINKLWSELWKRWLIQFRNNSRKDFTWDKFPFLSNPNVWWEERRGMWADCKGLGKLSGSTREAAGPQNETALDISRQRVQKHTLEDFQAPCDLWEEANKLNATG